MRLTRIGNQLVLVLALVVSIACGSTAAGVVATPTPSPTPPPSPTAAQILGTWHVNVTTTKVSGPVANKVGDKYDRTWVFSASCSTPGCVATLNSVTNSGPISIPVTYDGLQYRMAFDHTIPCSNGPVTNYAD